MSIITTHSKTLTKLSVDSRRFKLEFCKQFSLVILSILLLIFTKTATGQAGESLDFDGTNDIVTIADASWNDFGSNDFTIEVWIKKQAGSSGWSNVAGVGKWNTGGVPGSNEWLIGLTSDGNDELPTFSVEIGSTVYGCSATTAMAVGTWYHIAAVRVGTELKIYINGVLEKTTAGVTGSLNNVSGREILIARLDGFGGHTNMEMDELRIWNDARTASEIAAYMNCEIPTTDADLLANYHFNQGVAGANNAGETTLNDLAGSSRNGSLTGFALNGSTSNWVAPGSPATGISCAPVHNLTQNTYYNTIQAAINAANANDVIECAAKTYGEKLTIDKSLTLKGISETTCIIDGTGLGTGSGISINNGITNVSIEKFTIKNHAGTAPNSYAGIYAVGGNNNLSIKDCTIKDNVGGCGFYANGPVNGVTLDNLDVSGHTAAFGAARGIVIWNGFKQNISITNCDVYNNNCCGIELSDGTASGVTLSNNNVHDNADNGFGLLGLKAGAGANLISNNTVAKNGRFGIEIKNPNGNGTTSGDGSIYLDNNTVSFVTSAGMNVRDHAGIAVFRRSFQAGNPDGYPDVPTGVVIKNNTIDGYKHSNPSRTESEGFGIVIEGTNHEVTANNVKNNDIGIQQQGGGHPNPNYVPNDAGDGDQIDGFSATYFGRGNAPVACGNEISGNTFTSNGLNTRNSTPGSGGNGFVLNSNTGKTYCTIQAAIDDPQTLDGHVINVAAGTYIENLVLNKSLQLRGNNFGINPNTGMRNPESIIVPATSDPDPNSATAVTIMYLPPAASGSTIDGFTFDGDNPNLTSAVNINGANIDAIEAMSAYEGLSNVMVSNNIVKNLNYAGIDFYNYYNGGASTTGNSITENKFDNIIPTQYGIGALIYNNCYTSITDNVMTRVRVGIQTGNFYNADAGTSHTISGNDIESSRRGIFHNLAYTNATTFDISNNDFTTVAGATYNDGISISSIQSAVGVTLTNNNVTDARSGYNLWNCPTSNTVTINGGVLTDCQIGVFANNFDGYASDASSSLYAMTGVTTTNCDTAIWVRDNMLNSNAATVALQINNATNIVNGTGIGVLLEGADASVSFNGAVPVNFNTSLTKYISLISNGTNVPAADINAQNVQFGGTNGAGLTNAQLFAVEDKIDHKIDWKALGFVSVKANNDYVTDINAGQSATNNDYTRIRNAVEQVANNWTVNLKGSFDWTESNAATAWSLGNDGVASTSDDYSILVPANLNGVTFTAPEGLGNASINGPGDLATANLEGVLIFDGGDNQNWTISNMEFKEFDLAIGMFNGAGGSDAFNGTTITNNTFNIATDLNAVVAPADVNQNIGIHYSFGTNQTISNNTFNVPGDGVSNGANYSSTVCMQSNTSGGSVYDGLSITGNTINILNAQSATPQVVLGIWENAHGHSSNITVSNNQFLNLAGGNNPALNLQRAFRVTSHSSGASTVTYSGNTAKGANIGFQWIAGSNFSGEQAVKLTSNNLNGNEIGVLLQSNGKALITNNDFDDATDNTLDIQVQLGSILTTGNGNQFAGETYYIENLSATGLNISADLFDQSNNFRRTDRIYGALDNVASGLIRFNGDNLYVSAPGTGSSDETIPNAIAAAAATGDVINIETGTYASGADASSKEVTFAPGSSPGCVTLNGNMVLTAGDALAMEINGTIPCTDHDKFIVNGTVTLGGANLVVTLGYVPANGDQITIIQNDLADAVSGQFAQGNVITVSGYTFDINYAGGDGNDVVLTKCAGVTNTNTMENFCTIQAAIDDPQTLNGHTLTVSPGLFNENVIVNKELTITGAGKGNNPATNTVVKPSSSCNGTGFTIAAANVTIQNMYITSFQDAVLLNGVANPTLNNLALIDYCRYGVNFGGNNSDVDITNTDIQRTSLLAGTVG
ncbi:MAG: LamG-like jellyroll fold domain-containing protein, partial [Saprospiraceae bacterium]